MTLHTIRRGLGPAVLLLMVALRCIVGLARPDSGRIAIGGVDVSRSPIDARRHVSYLPQKSVFPVTLTVRETLAVVRQLQGLTRGPSIARSSCAGSRRLPIAASATSRVANASVWRWQSRFCRTSISTSSTNRPRTSIHSRRASCFSARER
jgi:ABC-type sugar transport system ATPase subunit